MSSNPLRLAVGLDGSLVPQAVARAAVSAENAGFTLVTLDDSTLVPGRIGAVERAAFIAASTTTIGIAPAVPLTYAEPFHVSSQLASLDHISLGRAGWVVSQEDRPEAARVWGRPVVEGVDALSRESADGVDVARALWDSWEDDAVIRSVATSRYLDRDRLHYIDLTGDTYAVKGPAIVPRPPQGQLVVLGDPRRVPADRLDVALIDGPDIASVRETAARTDTPLVFAEVEVALDTEELTGRQRAADWPEKGRLRHVGSAAGLVNLLAELRGSVDGVHLRPLSLDDDLLVLSRLVLPDLFTTRTATRPLPAATLRTNLGLTRPANRYEDATHSTTGKALR
ncbi:LLM class flavin-dependent oxidoreductase [Streptomyces acidiscabies]|uniref:LLM class flavin-dependent oxidoreductase n=1 Tax=Streptomyces acidiscabies TaxID=42234 RepID=A0AAP6EH95_9ACTN|nr:LLM class flavin-dependent oxidoreductase [Streptomyces acidiscabies]MBP5934719.1 LLM class flavin-dependent oxidoreductase [Streptomyces sp. LBUM 1476]MBZ3917552.1 LLM class flavin-dependent oxidoreductase [Streptomyces acidiscabies]MDX2962763.1 LLM class flavin-dependent oxidoreductase [Streptomyces acidiscabies]MDX3018930.1 LLM class flavin-dependent oxidoreductase [Streptomyces acidiscabies]MDX3790398.1 LLM class flavin-dependent oxidoreductase [Streptomyces acidiscabies]